MRHSRGCRCPKFKDFTLPIVFYKRLSDVFDDEFAFEREITLLDELFRAMLEELMTGWLSALPLVEHDKEPGTFVRTVDHIPWQEGDEPSEVLVRRMRGDG